MDPQVNPCPLCQLRSPGLKCVACTNRECERLARFTAIVAFCLFLIWLAALLGRR